MAQQRGMKRAAKVAVRKKKVNARAKVANARKIVRQAETKTKEE